MDILNHDVAEKEELLRKYNRIINIGRIAILAQFGYVMVRVGIAIYEMRSNGNSINWGGTVGSMQLILNAVIIALVAWSYKKPYPAMWWLAAIYGLQALLSFAAAVYFFINNTIAINQVYFVYMGVLIQCAVAACVVWGAIYARKYARLKRDIEYSLLEGMYEGDK